MHVVTELAIVVDLVVGAGTILVFILHRPVRFIRELIDRLDQLNDAVDELSIDVSAIRSNITGADQEIERLQRQMRVLRHEEPR